MRAQAKPRGLRDEQPVPYGNFVMGNRVFGNIAPAHVSDAMVLGLPAASRAVNLIANGVASMAPLKVLADDGVTPITPTPTIARRPNATMSPFTFWHSAVATALMRGNFVGLYADFDVNGYPRQVVPLPPQLVLCRYNGDGFLEYNFMGKRYTQLDLVHVPGMVLPGNPWGVGVVENFRRSLGAALEQQYMAADVYSRGAVPTGVLEVPLPNPDPTTVRETKEQWIEQQGHGQAAPAVLPQGWKYEKIAWSPEDLQFLESRQFMVAEVAFMFGLDPTDLSATLAGAASSLTYANVEQRIVERIGEAYGPWMLRFEQAWDDMVPGAQSCKFVPSQLMRTDSKTQSEVDKSDIESGVKTKDEARKDRGLPALTAAQKAESAPPPVVPAVDNTAGAAPADNVPADNLGDAALRAGIGKPVSKAPPHGIGKPVSIVPPKGVGKPVSTQAYQQAWKFSLSQADRDRYMRQAGGSLVHAMALFKVAYDKNPAKYR